MGFVERVKNEIHPKRIQNKTGGGTTIMDAAYNPSIMKTTFLPQPLKAEDPKAKHNGWRKSGQIDDPLLYKQNA